MIDEDALGPAVLPVSLRRRAGSAWVEAADRLAVEEPLTLRLAARGGPDGGAGERRTLAVTMRTPGDDEELALGFLHAEGLVRDLSLIDDVRVWTEEAEDGARSDLVEVALAVRRLPELRSLDRRHFVVSSACGVCGRSALDEMMVAGVEPARPPVEGPHVTPEVLAALPDALRSAQSAFAATGGLHAAALFDTRGRPLALREDVGRHNALDKLVGHALRAGLLAPDRRLAEHLLLVSGRASFELLQKAIVAGLPVVAAVSAPSSLAVEMAERFRITLVGFLRGERFNVYSHPERIVLDPAEAPSEAAAD